MKARTVLITFAILCIALITAAHIQRGEWGAGGEWILMFSLVPVAGMMPIKERRKR